jgi:hypothetical protein
MLDGVNGVPGVGVLILALLKLLLKEGETEFVTLHHRIMEAEFVRTRPIP